MMWIVAALILLFIAGDVAYNVVKSRRRPVSPTAVKRETERMTKPDPALAQLEAEVDRKLEELKRHPSAHLGSGPAVPAAMAAPAREASRDPMNDTRCMQAVKEKVEEVKRLAKDAGNG